VEFLQRSGLPAMLTFDRDPRWVGSASGRDFPSAFVRFLLCLGIQPTICLPHRPDKSCYVERLHRTYKYECL
jgi:transposase